MSSPRAAAAALLLLLAPTVAEAATPRVAVLTPTAAWSGRCDAGQGGRDAAFEERCSLLDQLADEMRSGALAALKGRDVMVMTRENTAQLLKEMGGGSGACSEGECEVETAKLIGADFVLSASVASIEGTWLATAKLHEVKSAKLLGMEKVRGAKLLELLDGTQVAAEALLRKAFRAGTAVAAGGAAAGAAAIFEEPSGHDFGADVEEVIVGFASDPAGAMVRVDGELICQKTPCQKRVAVGGHEAVFEMERYSGKAQRFTAAKGAAVKAALSPKFGWLSVETKPAGLGVAIDGVDAGKSPVAPRETDAGTVEVAISDRCYARVGEKLLMKAGERRTVKLAAKPRLAGLKVNAEDEKGDALEATVNVDGAEVGAAGARLSVPLCARKLVVKLGEERFEADLKLEEGKVTTLLAKPPSIERRQVEARRAAEEASAAANRASEEAAAVTSGSRPEKSGGFLKAIGKGEREQADSYMALAYRYGPTTSAAFQMGIRKRDFGLRWEIGGVMGETYRDVLKAAGEDYRFMTGLGLEFDPDGLPIYVGYQYTYLGKLEDSSYATVEDESALHVLYAGRRHGIVQVEAGAMKAEDRNAWTWFASAGLYIQF